MHKYILTLGFLILLYSCVKNPSDKPEVEESKVETTVVEESPKRVAIVSKEFKTKTGKTFIVSEEKPSASISKVSVVTKGFAEVNETLQLEESDPISKISIVDLNKDGFDEIFIITRSAGSGSYGTIYGFSSNKDKSVSSIIIPEISQSDLAEGAIFNGYQGHDSIYVSKNKLFRKFPIYKEGDENCCPSGGNKTIQYVIKPGENYWRLEVK
jgi:hypothetical protein